MSKLQQIVNYTRASLPNRKQRYPVARLEQHECFRRQPCSLVQAIRVTNKMAIIAEFKRMSPSRGVINAEASLMDTVIGYVSAGATAISILTNEKFFGGSLDDLQAARVVTVVPILRKDFIIDEYQVIETKASGADAILLIAAVLSNREIVALTKVAHGLGLEVLLEVHDELEIAKGDGAEIDLFGVNNRDLRDFSISVETSARLIGSLPVQAVKISESGINNPETVTKLYRMGFDGMLIGEVFMREVWPGAACAQLITESIRGISAQVMTHPQQRIVEEEHYED